MVSGLMQRNAVSLAVWDVAMPVVAGEAFAVKVGATSTLGQSLAGGHVEIADAAGAVVATGTLGADTLPGTVALYWTELKMPALTEQQPVEFAVRYASDRGELGQQAVASTFSVIVAAKPAHTLKVRIAEQETHAALGNVEIRLGPFHARTDKSGHAELHVCTGEYQIQLWRAAHIAQPTSIAIKDDASIELTMLHVPEEHPDARWVR